MIPIQKNSHFLFKTNCFFYLKFKKIEQLVNEIKNKIFSLIERLIIIRHIPPKSNLIHLTPHQAKKYLRYLAFSTSSFNNNTSWSDALNIRFIDPMKTQNSIKLDDFEVTPYGFKDYRTGLKIVLGETSKKEIFICFGAAGSFGADTSGSKMVRAQSAQMMAVFGNLLGFQNYLFQQAAESVSALIKQEFFKNKKVFIMGNSLGGTIASFASLKNKIPSICFNSLQLGLGQQQAISFQTLNEANKYVTHISTSNDYVSQFPGMRYLAYFLNTLRIRTIGNFGKKYIIPSLYNPFVSHGWIVKCMMQHIGYQANQKTADLSLEDKNACL